MEVKKMKKLTLVIITTFGILLISQHGGYSFKEINHIGFDDVGQTTGPNVELTLSAKKERVSWGQQIRYSIEVEDEVDGSSKYGEIESKKVLLILRYVPEVLTPSVRPLDERLKNKYPKGLSLVVESTCFGCHADKKSMVGPSFSEIAEVYEKQERNKEELINSVSIGSSGKWGEILMPPTPDFSKEEISEMVDYILKQGACDYCWVYPGIEGVFEVIEKPDMSHNPGAYVVSAAYTSSEGKRGSVTVLLKIGRNK